MDVFCRDFVLWLRFGPCRLSEFTMAGPHRRAKRIKLSKNTSCTTNYQRGPARINSDKRHGPKSSDSAQTK